MAATPPILIIEDNDLMLFRSLEEAGRFLEGPDVLKEPPVIFDALGHRFIASSASGLSDYSAPVTITQHGTSMAPEDLRSALMNALAALGKPSLRSATLSTLIDAAAREFGYTR
jgi:hypothetical protein